MSELETMLQASVDLADMRKRLTEANRRLRVIRGFAKHAQSEDLVTEDFVSFIEEVAVQQ
jgi:hypothetical protein